LNPFDRLNLLIASPLWHSPRPCVFSDVYRHTPATTAIWQNGKCAGDHIRVVIWRRPATALHPATKLVDGLKLCDRVPSLHLDDASRLFIPIQTTATALKRPANQIPNTHSALAFCHHLKPAFPHALGRLYRLKLWIHWPVSFAICSFVFAPSHWTS
jgi:hypothetical protein